MSSKPDIVVRDGKPSAVILDIEEYEALLERSEDAADLKRLRAMRKRRLSLKNLRTYLTETDTKTRRSSCPGRGNRSVATGGAKRNPW